MVWLFVITNSILLSDVLILLTLIHPNMALKIKYILRIIMMHDRHESQIIIPAQMFLL